MPGASPPPRVRPQVAAPTAESIRSSDRRVERMPVPLTARSLHDGWTVRAASGPVPAQVAASLPAPADVPGCVHLDLMRAGLIPDPYLDDNEALLAWIGLVDWEYRTTFEMDAAALASASVHDLVFDGLDTVAEVRLNGGVVARTANQHRGYRFDVTALLREGENELVVAFTSPIRYANAQSVALGARPRPYPLPYDAIRKSACSFGWDWGIATATSGLWRGVRLESWSTARLAEVLVTATPGAAAGDTEGGGGETSGTARLTGRVQRAADASSERLTVTLSMNGPGLDGGALPSTIVEVDGDRFEAEIAAEHIQPWWPVGYGDQPRYVVDVMLWFGGAHGVIDRTHRVVGFRTVEWDQTPDVDGTPFTLRVNGRPVFVKGVNWIPDDAFPVRVDCERYARRLDQAVAAHVNLVRVWGGGIYESDDFYDLCDERGLLTWQDFLFACAAYAEEEPLRGEVEAEARENIARLASHPSLVLLTGNNENLWGYEDWGWKRLLDGRTWGEYYYRELFPALVAELAPHVPYAPGSPFSPGGQHPNDPDHGTMHIWDLWNQRDWPHYRDHRPRFVAEFGWQGPPTWATLTRSIHDDPLTPESPGMIVHQKAADGNAKLSAGLVAHYRVPDDVETWHWAMQLNQANAITTALEHFRASAPRTMGAVVWQLNDCWPVTSWAAVDGDGRPKPLYQALRNAFAPRIVTIQPGDAEGELSVAIVNDTDATWAGALEVRRVGFDGESRASARIEVSAAARTVARLGLPHELTTPGDARSEVIVADLDGVRAFWYFAEPRGSALPAADIAMSVAAHAGDGVDVTLTARSFVRDVTLLVDKVAPDAEASTGPLTLLPGESATIRVSGVSAADAEALTSARVLRSANQLV